MKGYNRSIKAKSYLVNKGSQLFTKRKCEIHILASLEDKGYIIIEEQISIIGSFAIVYPDTKEYVIMTSMAMYNIEPESIRNVVVDDVTYYVFSIEANSPVVTSDKILIEGDLVYSMMDTYYFLGRIPWYLSYERGDVTQFFMTGGEHSGVAIDKVPAILSMLSASQARSKKDVGVLTRYEDKILDENTSYVAMKRHNDGVTQNFNKITGSYQTEGVLSAVVKNKTGNSTVIERIVRS